LYQGLFSGG